MISAQSVISRFRRDLTIGALLRGGLWAAAMTCIVILPLAGAGTHGAVLLVAVAALWILLMYRSDKGSRLAADSPFLIATGRFDEAEKRINAALRDFSLFRTGKLLSLHHLAVLRHAQRHWHESALLCRTLLGERLGQLPGLARPSSLLLADDLLHLGDLKGVYETLARLYRQRLNLPEAMTLQQLQLEYLARIGAFEPMLDHVKSKAQLAELMPTQQAARTQALLALAALKTGRNELCGWLKRRCELLCDTAALTADSPMMADLWPAAEVSGGVGR